MLSTFPPQAAHPLLRGHTQTTPTDTFDVMHAGMGPVSSSRRRMMLCGSLILQVRLSLHADGLPQHAGDLPLHAGGVSMRASYLSLHAGDLLCLSLHAGDLPAALRVLAAATGAARITPGVNCRGLFAAAGRPPLPSGACAALGLWCIGAVVHWSCGAADKCHQVLMKAAESALGACTSMPSQVMSYALPENVTCLATGPRPSPARLRPYAPALLPPNVRRQAVARSHVRGGGGAAA